MTEYISVRPTLIRRQRGDRIELATVPATDPEGSERALLVFMDEDQAEAFSAETGRFPASEGFVVGATHLEGPRAILWAWKLQRVALRGPEPEAMSELDADTFCEMLEPVGTPREG